MMVGSIKRCPKCEQESYIRIGIKECPLCGWEFEVYIPNKAPAGWVKMENYEISRRSVDKMLKSGDLTESDLR